MSNSFAFTCEQLDVAQWLPEYNSYMFPQADGTLQFGMGVTQLFSLGAYRQPQRLMNKTLVLDMCFILRPCASILLRAAQASGVGPDNPCYMLQFTDCDGACTVQLFRCDAQGNATALSQPIDLLGEIDLSGYNRYGIGIFNQGDDVRLTLSVNGKTVIDHTHHAAEEVYRRAGYLVFQGGYSVMRLRGTDSSVGADMGRPIRTGQVGDVVTYDLSSLQGVNTRIMSHITAARSFTASNGFTVNYRIALPGDYSAAKRYPLHMHLHGGGLRGQDNLTQIMGDFSQLNMLVQHQKKEPFIFIVPQCPSDRFWTDALSYDYEACQYSFDLANTPEPVQIAALAELVDSLTQEFSVDESRLYLSGCSMGGMGSYDLLARYPDKFAAAIVGCALSDVTMAEQLAKTPMYICHGEADATIPVQDARNMAAALAALETADYRYVEFAGRGHDFTTPHDLAEAMDWIYSKKR